MIILSPKTDFLGGSLVSASHLGKLFPGNLYTWKKKSEFLDINRVDHGVYIAGLSRVDKAIWCNDTCVDEGYYSKYFPKNLELFRELNSYDTIYLVNHQPISRQWDYLNSMLRYLEYNEVYLLNYRACWNAEFDYYIKPVHPWVHCATLPYHYYLRYTSGLLDKPRKGILSLGRSNSKCKIQSRDDDLNFIGATIHLPDKNLDNYQLSELLTNYKAVLTGYYYGGEGRREIDMPFNKLEWSFMDALLAGCIPVTSTLFSQELKRLGINAPLVGYDDFEGLTTRINREINEFDTSKIPEYQRILKEELTIGNNIIQSIMDRY